MRAMRLYSDLPNQQLALLRALADSLAAAQRSFAAMTPAKLDEYTREQSEICRQLRASARKAATRRIAETAPQAGELQDTARRVLQLNRIYGAWLRRRQRTVGIFCRVLESSGTTYPAPTRVKE